MTEEKQVATLVNKFKETFLNQFQQYKKSLDDVENIIQQVDNKNYTQVQDLNCVFDAYQTKLKQIQQEYTQQVSLLCSTVNEKKQHAREMIRKELKRKREEMERASNVQEMDGDEFPSIYDVLEEVEIMEPPIPTRYTATLREPKAKRARKQLPMMLCDDVLCLVLEYVDSKELLAFRLTSKKWFRVIHGDKSYWHILNKPAILYQVYNQKNGNIFPWIKYALIYLSENNTLDDKKRNELKNVKEKHVKSMIVYTIEKLKSFKQDECARKNRNLITEALPLLPQDTLREVHLIRYDNDDKKNPSAMDISSIQNVILNHHERGKDKSKRKITLADKITTIYLRACIEKYSDWFYSCYKNVSTIHLQNSNYVYKGIILPHIQVPCRFAHIYLLYNARCTVYPGYIDDMNIHYGFIGLNPKTPRRISRETIHVLKTFVIEEMNQFITNYLLQQDKEEEEIIRASDNVRSVVNWIYRQCGLGIPFMLPKVPLQTHRI
jgi:hypothetical protein